MSGPTVAPARPGGVRRLFVVTILAGSFLLFLVQPMVARMALPKLGGAPAVWNSAMLVYQALLLGGYGWAHWLGRFSPRVGAPVHLALLAIAALWLPIGLAAIELPGGAEPALWTPWLFVASIGPLFFAVSAQAPLIQHWYGAVAPGRDPYPLYAASNIGSFGGLLAYPLAVEPLLALRSQSLLWSAGYALLVVLVAGCWLAMPRGSAAVPDQPAARTSPPPRIARVAHWIALAFVPSGLMLATSTFITTDIVAVPLLWVLPLGLYLLSFTVAFAADRAIADLLARVTPVSILLFGGVMIGGGQETPYLNATMALLLLFMVSVALHARLYALRPEPARLTGYYLAMSFGGALGGVFAGLIAPVIFDWTYEYPLLILAAGALTPQAYLLPVIGRLWHGDAQGVRIRTLAIALAVLLLVFVGLRNPGGILGDKHENLAFLAIAAVGLFAIGRRGAFMVTLFGALFLFGGWRAIQTSLDGRTRVRSYFGVYTIRDYTGIRTLAHGTTVHGIEAQGSPERERRPTSYYVERSGIGRAMRAVPALYGPNARIAVVGLGTGTLACYAQPGQRWRFFEIDPAMVAIARDPAKFRFLARCLPNADIVVGDARLQLAALPPASIDLLALDAFSSDAVPMHLMTREAFAGYARLVAPHGLLMVHVSNRFLDLAPVVAAAARAGGWHATRIFYRPPDESEHLSAASDWIALSKDAHSLAALTRNDPDARPLSPRPGFPGWSDDYATILPLLKLR